MSKAAFWPVCALIMVLGTAPVQAQVVPATEGPVSGLSNPLAQLQQRLAQSATLAAGFPLEGAVDDANYFVGPGDVLSLTIGGPEPVILPLTVTPDGAIVVPDVGRLNVAGLTLQATRDTLWAAVKPVFQHVKVDVALAQPRQFYVHVSGAVPVPGRFLAMPVARVSTVLEQAFFDTTRTPVSHVSYRPSFRNIQVIHRDGTTMALDLLQYFTTGDTAHNPYLRDGDVITVPAYDPDFEAVYVDGAVPFPGAYDYRAGDTIADLLRLATGQANTAETIRLSRMTASGAVTTQTVTDPGYAVQPRDHLFIGPDRVPGGTATVSGHVHFPGTYPITYGQTTLQDLLEQAGGLRSDALRYGAYLERSALPMPTIDRANGNRFEQEGRRPVLLREDSLAILNHLRVAEMGFLSRTYFARSLRLQGRVAVDLETALQAGADPVYLQDGDRLVVPRDIQSVFVFGQVYRPGHVAYVEGRDAAYYITQAGGRSPLAHHAYVVKAGTGEYVLAEEATIRSGDLVFLDRETPVADDPELARMILDEERLRTDRKFRTTQTVLQVIGSTASILALIIALRKQ